LDASELAFKRAVVIEGVAIDDFYGAPTAQNIAREPDFAVTAAADFAQQFVIGNGGRDWRTDRAVGFARWSLLVPGPGWFHGDI